MNKTGSIVLIGAGPGDVELLTLKALKALETADVVLFDALASEAVVARIPEHTQKIPVGKKGYGPSCRQDDINALMIELALQGKRVARLKGGDPLIFSRAGEELEAARAAGVAVEVIPGITAAQAAAAALCAPLTHRHHARRLQFITGHDHKGALPDNIDWASVADPVATTVVYMAKRTLAAFSEMAQANGLASDTPAALVMNASLPAEYIIRSSIKELPGRAALEALDGPVLVLIGQALCA